MSAEAELAKLEARALGGVKGWLDEVDSLRQSIAMGESNIAQAVLAMSTPSVEAQAGAAVVDAYGAGIDDALTIMDGVDIGDFDRAAGRPSAAASELIQGLDQLGQEAMEKARELIRAGADAQTTAAPIFGHATRVRRSVSDAVNLAGNEGVTAIADAAGLPTVWVAETNACVDCLAYSGRVAKPGDTFPGGLSYGKHRSSMDRLATPPKHPNCRCTVEPLNDPSYAAALRREADRSVLRGFSLPNESMRSRVDAASRLLDRGVDAPKSVIAYAQRAVKRGTFPTRGRPGAAPPRPTAPPAPPAPPRPPAPRTPPAPPRPTAPLKAVRGVAPNIRKSALASGDWRYIEDRNQRATVLLQNEYRSEQAVKKVAKNIREGAEPFDGVGVPKGWIKEYTGTVHDGIEPVRFTEADVRGSIEDAARWLNEQPKTKPRALFKGLDVPKDKVDKLFSEGADFDANYSSFTTDEVVARRYSSMRGSRQVMVRTKGIEAIPLKSNPTAEHWKSTKEHLVTGKGRIVKVTDDGRTVWVDVEFN